MGYTQEGWLKRAKGPIGCHRKPLSYTILLGAEHYKDDTFANFMRQVILMSLVSHALYIVLRPLKQPKFVCNALGGIIVSPHIKRHGKLYEGKFSLLQEQVLTRTVAYLGLAYYIFIVAVKMDLSVLQRTARRASIIGLSSLLAPFVIILLTTFQLPSLRSRPGLFLCLFSGSLSQTRFPHAGYTFHELNIVTSDLAQLAMSSSMVSEISTFVWIIIFLLHTQHTSATLVLLSALVFLSLIGFFTFPIVKLIIKKTPEGKQMKEKYIVLLLLAALDITMVGDMLGTIQLGVLVMGLIIPNGPPLGATLSERAEHFVTDVLMPMFYVAAGYSMDVSSLDLKASWEIILCVFLSIIAKFLGAFLSAAMLCRFKFGHATLLGLMMNVKGPLDFFAYISWLNTKDIEVKTYTVLVLSQILLMGIFSPLIEGIYDLSIRQKSLSKRSMKSIQKTASDVQLQILCCIQNEDSVTGVISLIETMRSNITSPIRAHVVHQNELIGRVTPFIAPYDQQLKGRTSKNCHHIMQAFENYSQNSNSLVKVKPFVITAPIKSLHEYICRLSQEELVSLIIVPFHGNQEVSVPRAFSLRNLTRNLQAYAPCTVGILVDKGMGKCASLSSFSCAIAVVFMGGADDREALALATRMSGHTNVRVMLLQIIVANNIGEENIIDDREMKLDFASVDQFVIRAVKNNRGTHRKVTANNVEDAIDEIRKLGDQFNLVIIGHQQKTTKLKFIDAMLNWTENPELGVIGDIIASPCFGGGKTSVLVMKHCENDREK